MIKDIDKTTSLHLNNEAQFLCFTLEERGEDIQLYAMNVFKIREVIYYVGEVTQTAGENDNTIVGFLTVRGESIPLVDMRRWLYFDPNDPYKNLKPYSVDDDRLLVVICNFSNFTVGIRIKNVKRIIHRNWNDIKVGSEYGFASDSKVTATTKYDDGAVIQILDVEKMVSDSFPNINSLKDLEMQMLTNFSTTKSILIAEDSKSASSYLQSILEKLELKYMAFADGRALLNYVNAQDSIDDIAAIITDLEMPKISGFEVLKQIKNNEKTKNLPVIINSSMSSDSNHQMAKSLKADAFITKSNPVEIEEALRKFI